MRNLRLLATAALSTVMLAGCGPGDSGSRPPGTASATSPIIQPVGAPIDDGHQLQSTQQLQSDIHAVEAAATEQTLQDAVSQLQRDYQAVAGSQPTNAATEWQQALTALQQALTDVQKLAAANSSAPTAPSPLKSASAGGGSKSSSDTLSELKTAYDLLSSVVKILAYTIIVNNADNGGGVVATGWTPLAGPYPLGIHWPPLGIRCGQAQHNCSGVVLAFQTVVVTFTANQGGAMNYYVGPIDSTGNACNGYYANGIGKSSPVDCSVTASGGQTISITPHWVQ